MKGGSRTRRCSIGRTFKIQRVTSSPALGRLVLLSDLSHSSRISNMDFETVAKQEVTRLEKLHPTPEDIPGCMGMLDSFLSCNGA